ncbi:anti-sigma factor family protein [Ekhidna sp.]
MNYKPEEQTLIAYLYGELSGDEKKKVEEYLSGNDNARKELEELTSVRSIFGNLKDREVDIPTFTFSDSSKVVVGQRPSFNFWKKTLAIAASVVLVLFVGYLTKFQVSLGSEGFQVAFGETKEQDYDQAQVESMIASAIKQNNDQLNDQLQNTEAGMKQLIADKSQSLQAQFVNQKTFDNNEFVDQRQQFLETFRKMLETSELDQKKYTDEVLTDFAIYLDVQRQNDIEVIQTQFNNLQDDAELNQIQTNEILANIISSVDQPNLNQY